MSKMLFCYISFHLRNHPSEDVNSLNVNSFAYFNAFSVIKTPSVGVYPLLLDKNYYLKTSWPTHS